MKNLRPLLLALALLALAGGVAACGDDDSSSSSTTAAGGEDASLTIYSGRDEELVQPLLDRFTEETGIELEVRYGDTAELAATIREEGDRSPADVFFGQDAGALGALEKEDLLAELPQETLDLVQAGFRSDAGRWVGTSGRARVIAYDTRELSPEELPDSVLELTDEKWKGKVAWAPTNASFQAFVTALRQVEGEQAAEDWLVAMRENDAQVYERNGLIRDAVAAGEVPMGLINHYYVMQARAEAEDPDSYPVGLHFPTGGDAGALVNVAGAAVLASSEQQEQARQLIDFLLGTEAQEYFRSETAEYPVAAGVEPLETLPPLSDIQQPELDLSDIDDLQGTLELLQRAGIL